MIDIEIDGKKLTVPDDSMVIEAADEAGIYIPRFCYHNKLSIVANCRMCLVEVKNSNKPLPACATPVTSGMKVFTQSKFARDAQRSVMEFLLINHPLDCPICDQGGECELQDLSIGFGKDVSRFTEGKRVVADEDLGPLIATDMTRCIHCTRCVRFGEEIAGMRELGATYRGEDMRISTYIKHAVQSEVSGNIIDLCPVGALTSKPYRFTARPWELQQFTGVAPHDCWGSNIHIHTRGYDYKPQTEVMRVVPHINESINEVWLSDRDRFGYEGINHPTRLLTPKIKQKGQWCEVDWPTALQFSVDGLKRVIDKFSADKIGALLSPSATLEEGYLLQRLLRGIGCHNIDHRLRHSDFSAQDDAPLYPHLGLPIAELEQQNAILLIGSNIRHEQPLAALRLRKASKQNARIMAINPIDYDFNFSVDEKIITAHQQLPHVLAEVAKALGAKHKLVNKIKPSDAAQSIAKQLKAAEKTALLLGAAALQHPQAAMINALAHLIAEHSAASVGQLTAGANAAGAWLAGAVPHRGVGGSALPSAGMNVRQMLSSELKAFVLLGIEPEFDCAQTAQAMQALDQAEFVVTLTAFADNAAEQYADVLLPMASFAETSGTFVNVAGVWQSFKAVSPAPGNTRPAWKIVRVLGNLFDCAGFDYQSSGDVRQEIKQQLGDIPQFPAGTAELAESLPPVSKDIMSSHEWLMVCVDPIVRRATALQATLTEQQRGVHINVELAAQLKLTDGQQVVVKQHGEARTLLLVVNDRVPAQVVWLPMGIAETKGFGEAYAAIEIEGK